MGIRLAVPDRADFMVSSTPTSVTYSKAGALAAAQCAVTYRASSATSGEVAVTDLHAGCY